MSRFSLSTGLVAAVLTMVPTIALAAGPDLGVVQQQATNWPAIGMFVFFVLFTLGITYKAAKGTKSAADFYAAGGGISAGTNALAIAGDYMSAASFLGISGLVYTYGFDGLVYSTGFLVGWPIVLFLIAERLRNLGKFTFADVASFRLNQTAIRMISAVGTLVVVALYLIAQMVGAGKLIQLLFGMPYLYAVVIVGALMIIYVAFGGMKATTWVQVIKACLLLGGATFMAGAVLYNYDFSPDKLFAAAVKVHPGGEGIMAPSGNPASPVFSPIDALSLGVGLMFGTAGLPHILMRFFTVSDAQAARKSVFYATGLIGYFYILTFIIGFGAITFLMNDPTYFKLAGDCTVEAAKAGTCSFDKIKDLIGGAANMPAVNLAAAVAGPYFFGFICAVAFATILAVVAGLTLAGASAVSHDLYAQVFARGRATEKSEVNLSKASAVVIGIVAIYLGYVFETQNVAFMVGLAFSVAASCNFPVLAMSILWRDTTTLGALAGGLVGLVAAVVMVVLSPDVWVKTFGHAEALFPYKNPALFSMPLAFITIVVVSKLDKTRRAQRERAAFDAQYVRSETGIGAAAAHAH